MSGVGASVRDTRVLSWSRDEMRSNEQHDSSEAAQAIMGLRRELMGVCLALGRWYLYFYFLIRVRGRDCIASDSQLRGNLLLAVAIPSNCSRPSIRVTKNGRMRLPRNEALCFQFLMQCFVPLSKERASRCFPSHRTSVGPCQWPQFYPSPASFTTLTCKFRSRGPSNSQKNTPCQRPNTNFPPSTWMI